MSSVSGLCGGCSVSLSEEGDDRRCVCVCVGEGGGKGGGKREARGGEMRNEKRGRERLGKKR